MLIHPEVAEALAAGRPLVALESTIIRPERARHGAEAVVKCGARGSVWSDGRQLEVAAEAVAGALAAGNRLAARAIVPVGARPRPVGSRAGAQDRR